MSWGLVLIGLLTGGAIFAPLICLIRELAAVPAAWSALGEISRLLGLAHRSLLLAVLTAAMVTLPAAFLGLALARLALPGRGLLALVLISGALLPLPLQVTGWLSLARSLDLLGPREFGGWGSLLAAACMHAVHALPWASLVIALGWRTQDPALLTDALLAAPPWRVWRRIELPRAMGWLGLALLVTAVQTWCEIAIADLWQVRTLAAEVYVQCVAGDDAGLARAVAALAPFWFALAALSACGLQIWFNWHPSELTQHAVPTAAAALPLGVCRWPSLILAWSLAALPSFGPGIGLILGVGRDLEVGWSFANALGQLGFAVQTRAVVIAASVAMSLAAALACVVVATWALWVTLDSRRGRWLVVALVSLALLCPAPLHGFSLQLLIQALLETPLHEWTWTWLYGHPSPLPLIWAILLRYWAWAALLLGPVFAALPPLERESTRLDGGRGWRLFLLTGWPRLALPVCIAWGIVACLAFGEMAASKIVATPGWTPFAHDLFIQLHSGADAPLAAACLLVYGCVLIGGLTLGLGRWTWRGAVRKNGVTSKGASDSP